jgi:hypothetical protein
MGQAVVVLIAVVAGLVAASAGTPRERDAPPSPAAEPAPRDVEPAVEDPGRVMLLAHRAADARTAALIAVGFAGDGTGSAVLVPPTTLIAVPSLGTQAVADAELLGSAELLETAIENVLGIAVDETVVLDDAMLVPAISAAAHLQLELTRAVRVDDPFGGVALDAGVHDVDAATAVRLLTGVDTATDLEHQLTVRSVIEAWRARLVDEAVASDVVALVPALEMFVAHAGDRLRYETLPVEAISVFGDARYQVRAADTAALVEHAFPWARAADAGAG